MQKVVCARYWPESDMPKKEWGSGVTGFHENHLIEFPEDTLRIVRAFLRHGYTIDPATAADLWERRSNEYDAGWLILPSEDGAIIEDINEFCFDGKLELPTEPI
jgi:hypothetical protein